MTPRSPAAIRPLANRAAPLESFLLAAYLLFVVYGSLLPFDLRPIPLDQAWRQFQAMPFLQLGVESRADWIANGVLYLPVAFLIAWRLVGATWHPAAAACAAVAFGVAMALGVEFAQLYFPARTVSMNDVLAEVIGSVLGALLALRLRRPRFAMRTPPVRPAGAWLRMHALTLYAAAYLGFCLFPFDILISRTELLDKLASNAWGWWLAGIDRGLFRVGLQLLVEVALTAPLGVLLGEQARGRAEPGVGRAAFAGLLLGLLVEVGQLLIASGVSQGLSVLSRAVGVVAGLLLWRRRRHLSVAVLRPWLARAAVFWVPANVLLILAVNGWFTRSWLTSQAALGKWAELRLLPFYYHYYTTEAQALVSLASVVLMYAPLGVWGWACGRPAWRAALVCATLATLVESGKLWLAGLHPDPTNVLIAAAAALVAGQIADAWSASAHTPEGPPVASLPLRPVDAVPAAATQPRSMLGVPLLLAAGLASAWYFISAPALAPASIAILGACACAVWMRPIAALFIVPALLPVLDLAPWTGRFFVDEFDLLLAICLGVGFLRPAPAGRDAQAGWWGLAFVLLASSYAISLAVGAMPWPWPDANSDSNYHSPYNALRIAKGVLWAWLFVRLLRRLDAGGAASRTAVAAGMSIGLACVVGFVLWERIAFAGLFDFAGDYRVTGPFSAMHRGGAFIECYLAVAVPFLALQVVDARQRWLRVAAAVLLLGASYAAMVTFSRNGYVAFGVVLLFLLWLARGPTRVRRGAFVAAVVVGILAIAWPVLSGPFARERLARWGEDLAVRQAHWADALALRDRDLPTAIWGMGLGRFPQTHFWRSAEPVHAGSYALGTDGRTSFLRLGGGATLYIDQIVSVTQPGPHRLRLRLKADQPAVAFELSVCEKWMLTSRTCVGARALTGSSVGSWIEIDLPLDLTPLGSAGGRRIKLSLHSPPAGSVVDVAGVSLQAPGGDELLSNGTFVRGLDRWFFSTDVDPPWHVHSLPVGVLFDQGWVGIAAWALLIAIALNAGVRNAIAGDRNAAAALAALLAFMVCGSLNTLIDDPRFLFLLLVVTALCVAGRAPATVPGVKGGRRESTQP